MDYSFKDEAEVMDLTEDSKRITIACPNPGMTWKDTYGQKEFVFEPFKKKLMREPEARMFIARAMLAWENQKVQAAAERKMWAECMSAESYVKRDRASKYCDANGNPRTKPLPRPGLVDLGTAQGQAYYESGIKEAEAAEAAARSSSTSTSTTTKEPVRDASQPASGGLLDLSGDAEAAYMKATEIKVEIPKEDWKTTRLQNYLVNHKVDVAGKGRTELFGMAMDQHERKMADLAKTGQRVTVV